MLLDTGIKRPYFDHMRVLILFILLNIASTTAWAQSEDEIAFAKDFLDQLQIRSIINDREYCGYFYRAADGRMLATRPIRGKYNSCSPGSPPPFAETFANYHTHAAFTPDSINEIPSLQDLRSDMNMEMNGYVSTPGGRLWFSDYKAKEVRQICGIGCVAQDPDFRPGRFYKVRRRYTLNDLERF